MVTTVNVQSNREGHSCDGNTDIECQMYSIQTRWWVTKGLSSLKAAASKGIVSSVQNTHETNQKEIMIIWVSSMSCSDSAHSPSEVKMQQCRKCTCCCWVPSWLFQGWTSTCWLKSVVPPPLWCDWVTGFLTVDVRPVLWAEELSPYSGPCSSWGGGRYGCPAVVIKQRVQGTRHHLSCVAHGGLRWKYNILLTNYIVVIIS